LQAMNAENREQARFLQLGAGPKTRVAVPKRLGVLAKEPIRTKSEALLLHLVRREGLFDAVLLEAGESGRPLSYGTGTSPWMSGSA